MESMNTDDAYSRKTACNNPKPDTAKTQQTNKDNRVSFEEIYMQLAFSLAQRSTCKRLKVGCVIVSEDYSYVYGIGYNGNAKGFANTCESEEPGNCGCLHAEENALLKTNAGADIPKIVFVTNQPCAYCAKRLINKGGVKKIFYAKPYRLKRGLEILAEANIPTEQLNFQQEGEIIV